MGKSDGKNLIVKQYLFLIFPFRSPYFEWNSATDVSESKSEIAQRHIKKINEVS